MVLDKLKNRQRYRSLHPGFKSGFEFLRHHPLADLTQGLSTSTGIDYTPLGVATVGKGRNGASFETHSKYIEIQ